MGLSLRSGQAKVVKAGWCSCSNWKISSDTEMRENPEVTRLFRMRDPGDRDFGLAPTQWDEPVGSVLVIRDDCKDITPQQVEALCHFMAEQPQKRFDKVRKGRLEAKELLALFTPDEFGKFFANSKGKKVVEMMLAGWQQCHQFRIEGQSSMRIGARSETRGDSEMALNLLVRRKASRSLVKLRVCNCSFKAEMEMIIL